VNVKGRGGGRIKERRSGYGGCQRERYWLRGLS
jgi:hypothetical protein